MHTDQDMKDVILIALTEIERLRTALVAMRDRDDRNGSLPEAYREIIDGVLEQPDSPG